MEFRLTVSAASGSAPSRLWIEPEGHYFELPAEGPIVLSFRGPDVMDAELDYGPDAIIIFRPMDTEVWARPPGQESFQIAGFRNNPAPGLDSAGAPMDGDTRKLIKDLFHPGPPPPTQPW